MPNINSYIKAADISSLKRLPGVYFFWMKSDTIARYSILMSKPLTEEYAVVYIGSSKDIRQRLNWHWNDPFLDSNCKAGAISTLNQSIGAILELPTVDENYNTIKIFMDDNMFSSALYTETTIEANVLENSLIRYNDCPLNILSNNQHPYYTKLKQLRKLNKNKGLDIIKQRP